jgi:hypothetical protein
MEKHGDDGEFELAGAGAWLDGGVVATSEHFHEAHGCL